jgi:ATP-dependent helicase/nuclease subunit B
MVFSKNSGTQTASAVFFDGAARRILEQHLPPDLRNVIILLPNYHAAQPLTQALMRAAQRPALLLPQMVTLNEWALSMPLDSPIAPESQRSALLYQQLRKQQWFENVDLWSMTQELLKLFDELTYALNDLPLDAESFAATVQQAYQARHNETLQLEARLVFVLWHAMNSGEELNVARAYQQRLAKLAVQADRPLYVLRTSDWDVLEQRFLDEYAKYADVAVFDLREMNALTPSLSQGKNENIRFFAATSLEQEAQAAAMQVRLWLNEGKSDIAVVAQDRVVARRLRALLERAEILVSDETGWTFATLSVSTILDRWLTALQSDFYHHDLLDLFKSSFIFGDMPASERKAAVYQLEQLLRKQGVVSGLDEFLKLAAHEDNLHQLLLSLQQAATVLALGKRKTLTEWLALLREGLLVLGIVQGLQQDAAGVKLLNVLDALRQELVADSGRHTFSEWRRWLAQQLDTQTYRDSSIDSTVRFTHLTATRWRAFDAVILLGCDANHLPSVVDGGRWFNDAVRSALNLATRATHTTRQHDDLLALCVLNDTILVTWQKERNGEQCLLSPYLQILRDKHALTGGDALNADELHDYLAADALVTADLPLAEQPTPVVSPDVIPNSVSISAYNSLVACPYQFYARYILRLNELDEVQESIEKRDYGERVHEILRRFHERYSSLDKYTADELELALRQISETIFSDLLEYDFVAQAWLERWYKSLPAYLEWQAANETQGWRYAEAESAFDIQLSGVNLRGRIDRLDVKENEKRVLDYKMQSDQLLRNKLKDPGEDVQLACYAFAHQAGDAAFVSIENGKVKSITPPHDVGQLAQLNIDRLEQVMANIREGKKIPANGIEAACQYCEMRGACRKGEWS